VDESERESSLAHQGTRTRERLRDAGLLLAWVSATCTLMVYVFEGRFGLTNYPSLHLFLFFLYNAGIPVCLSWAAALVAHRWQSVGAVLLIVTGLAHVGWTLDRSACSDIMRCRVLPLGVVVSAWLAAALLLRSRLMSPNPHATGTDE
jgi:hypothetical protein